MNKKEYKTPTIEVVELKQTGMLMTSGDRSAAMSVIYEEEDI